MCEICLAPDANYSSTGIWASEGLRVVIDFLPRCPKCRCQAPRADAVFCEHGLWGWFCTCRECQHVWPVPATGERLLTIYV